MSGSRRSIVLAAALAGALLTAAGANAAADTQPTGGNGVTREMLTDRTLTWPDGQGRKNLMHLGRFGNFDWYVPCVFESGDWTLDADHVLRLTYHNPLLEPRQYRLSHDDGGIALTEPDGGTAVATLQEGDRLPYF